MENYTLVMRKFTGLNVLRAKTNLSQKVYCNYTQSFPKEILLSCPPGLKHNTLDKKCFKITRKYDKTNMKTTALQRKKIPNNGETEQKKITIN